MDTTSQHPEREAQAAFSPMDLRRPIFTDHRFGGIDYLALIPQSSDCSSGISATLRSDPSSTTPSGRQGTQSTFTLQKYNATCLANNITSKTITSVKHQPNPSQSPLMVKENPAVSVHSNGFQSSVEQQGVGETPKTSLEFRVPVLDHIPLTDRAETSRPNSTTDNPSLAAAEWTGDSLDSSLAINAMCGDLPLDASNESPLQPNSAVAPVHLDIGLHERRSATQQLTTGNQSITSSNTDPLVATGGRVSKRSDRSSTVSTKEKTARESDAASKARAEGQKLVLEKINRNLHRFVSFYLEFLLRFDGEISEMEDLQTKWKGVEVAVSKAVRRIEELRLSNKGWHTDAGCFLDMPLGYFRVVSSIITPVALVQVEERATRKTRAARNQEPLEFLKLLLKQAQSPLANTASERKKVQEQFKTKHRSQLWWHTPAGSIATPRQVMPE